MEIALISQAVYWGEDELDRITYEEISNVLCVNHLNILDSPDRSDELRL